MYARVRVYVSLGVRGTLIDTEADDHAKSRVVNMFASEHSDGLLVSLLVNEADGNDDSDVDVGALPPDVRSTPTITYCWSEGTLDLSTSLAQALHTFNQIRQYSRFRF